MNLTDLTQKSKIAATIKKVAGRIKNDVHVTISEHAPESIKRTGALPRTKGWRIMTEVPMKTGFRKNYVKFLQETKYKEVWIRVSTLGGPSKVYGR